MKRKLYTVQEKTELLKAQAIEKIVNSCVTGCEKGTIENINGLIGRFFPKGTDFDTIKHKEIKQAGKWINNRPPESVRIQNS